MGRTLDERAKDARKKAEELEKKAAKKKEIDQHKAALAKLRGKK